jgi:hypothetical protein
MSLVNHFPKICQLPIELPCSVVAEKPKMIAEISNCDELRPNQNHIRIRYFQIRHAHDHDACVYKTLPWTMSSAHIEVL